MKKYISLTILILVLGLSIPTLSFAQGMTGNGMMGSDESNTEADNGHTARGEAEGKITWEKLQVEELNCGDLNDDDFHALGMYFMGLMVGDSHEAMDTMMEQMMGEEGEDQMHIALGKRMSGCEPNAPMPQSMMNGGMMQMMMGGGMMGGGSNPFSLTNNSNNPMMNFGFAPFGWLGGIFMILFWVLVIVGIIALVRWLASQNRDEDKNARSALDVLKERYAKGEIDKKEFEEKKKDLS